MYTAITKTRMLLTSVIALLLPVEDLHGRPNCKNILDKHESYQRISYFKHDLSPKRFKKSQICKVLSASVQTCCQRNQWSPCLVVVQDSKVWFSFFNSMY